MDEEPDVNDVRLGVDGELLYFDGTAWVRYPDLPDGAGLPIVVTRGEEH